MLTLFGARATRAFRPLWLLEELGLDYEHRPVGPRAPEVVALNGSGKVPVLTDGDAVIGDSMAILTYLSDREGRFTAPAGTVARARQDALTFRLLDEVETPLWTAAKHSFILPETARVAAIKPVVKDEFARAVGRIADDLTTDWLMGDEMTVPDILLIHCLSWGRSAGFPDAPETLKPYIRRARAREAFQRASALA